MVPSTYLILSLLESRLVSVDSQGNEIGYQDSGSEFNGRQPFVYQLYEADPNDLSKLQTAFPLAQIHAPFGANEGLRVKAINGLLRLVTLNPNAQSYSDLRLQPMSIVAGDFNVKYNWNEDYSNLSLPIPNNSTNSTRAYAPFVLYGFTIQISESSTLTTVNSADPSWTDSEDYRSSAYDNIITRGVQNVTAHKIVDLVDDLYQYSNVNGYLGKLAKVPQMNTMFYAFKYYREQISDHLPALLTVTVSDRP
jgi:hypothetical protein